MTKRAEVIAKWRKMWAGKQNEQKFFFALTGDGSSAATADVADRAKWAWVRYNEKPDRVSQVLNLRFPGIAQDVPVIVGKQYPHDRYYQILGMNTSLYYMHWTDGNAAPYGIQAHGGTHTYGTGNDPAWINTGNILLGKVRETEPVSMGVYAAYTIYEYEGSLKTWTGGSIDLTDYLPTLTNYHKYVLVSLNPDTEVLEVTDGVQVPITIAPSVPDVPIGNYPLAAVVLEDSTTSITDEEIYDYRLLWGAAGAYVRQMNEGLAVLEAEFDYMMSRHWVNGT